LLAQRGFSSLRVFDKPTEGEDERWQGCVREKTVDRVCAHSLACVCHARVEASRRGAGDTNSVLCCGLTSSKR